MTQVTEIRRAIAREIYALYCQAVDRSPVWWVLASCLALVLACTIAFGIHP